MGTKYTLPQIPIFLFYLEVCFSLSLFLFSLILSNISLPLPPSISTSCGAFAYSSAEMGERGVKKRAGLFLRGFRFTDRSLFS